MKRIQVTKTEGGLVKVTLKTQQVQDVPQKARPEFCATQQSESKANVQISQERKA